MVWGVEWVSEPLLLIFVYRLNQELSGAGELPPLSSAHSDGRTDDEYVRDENV